MKKHEPKYIEVEGIMRACYDSFLKTGNKAYSEIFALVEAVPAADVVEVKHGRWEYTKELYRDPNGNHLFYGKICSECNSVSPYDSPYCMNCGANMQQDVTLVGAKMDEKEDPDLPQEAYYNKGLLRWKIKDEVEE